MEDNISAIREEAGRRGLLRRKTATKLFVPYCYQAVTLITTYILFSATDHPFCHLLLVATMVWIMVSAWRV
jgi:hypothetical protein